MASPNPPVMRCETSSGNINSPGVRQGVREGGVRQGVREGEGGRCETGGEGG